MAAAINPHSAQSRRGRHLVSQPIAAYTANCSYSSEEEGVPFDPGPIDPDGEPDLFPPDLHENGANKEKGPEGGEY